MNSKHQRTLEAIWAEPVDGNLGWARIESLPKALGCRVVADAGSSVTFEWKGTRVTFDRPQPGGEALRYRIRAIRELLGKMGHQP